MTILETMGAGVVGTTLMTLVMSIVHERGWATADMIRAIGSAVTGSYERSFKPGLLLHFALGIVFAFPYVLVLAGVNLPSIWGMIGVGGLIGFVHGFVMSFILIAAVAEKHPVQQFQRAGFEVAAAHVLGHVAYGVGVGAIAALLSIDFGLRL
jgi:uncharacterized membrane protein YagU involved in acid resistance